MDRKSFFTDGVRQIAKKLYDSPVGQAIDRRLQGAANLLAPEGLSHRLEARFAERDQQVNETYVRPPGATEAFDELCTQCSDCEEACPHGTIFSIEGSGPLVNTNVTACLLCEDFPCIAACTTGALEPLEEGLLPGFGRLAVEEGLCANSDLSRDSAGSFACSECILACPVEGALQMRQEALIPEATNLCTGCGQCLPACPAFPVALSIAPVAEEEL